MSGDSNRIGGPARGRARKETRTGGRPATDGVIPGRYSLSVGKPDKRVPPGWTWTPLTEVARLETGHTPSRRHPEYWGGDIPWIGIRDATENHGRTLDDTYQHTNSLGIANSSARVLPAGTVCLSRTASVGYVLVMGRPMATSQDFVNWVCSDQIDPDFLKYVLLAEHDAFLTFASGTTHQTIYFPEVNAFHVCLPSLDIQRKVAAILTAYDDLTENNNRQIKLLEEMARRIYHEWFVDFRYPGNENVPFVDSDLGRIPAGWQVAALGSVAENLDRMRKPLSGMVRALRPGPYPYYGAAKIFDFIDDYIFDGTYLLVAEDGSVITPDGRAVLQYVSGRFWANNHTHVLQGTRLSTEHLYLLLADLPISGYITGAAQPKITQANMNRIPCVVSGNEVATAFNRIVRPLFLAMGILESRSATLRSSRDLLLPRLISGVIDVTDLNIAMPDIAA